MFKHGLLLMIALEKIPISSESAFGLVEKGLFVASRNLGTARKRATQLNGARCDLRVSEFDSLALRAIEVSKPFDSE